MIRLKNLLQEDNGGRALPKKSAATQLPTIIDRKKADQQFDACVKSLGFKWHNYMTDPNNASISYTTWDRSSSGDQPYIQITINNKTHEYMIGTKKWSAKDILPYMTGTAKADAHHSGQWKPNDPEYGCGRLKAIITDTELKKAANPWPSVVKSIKKKS